MPRLVVVILMTLLLVLLPLNAQPAVADVTMIDPSQPHASLLAPGELETLATLQNTSDLQILSEVSPDDRAVVVLAIPLGSAAGDEPDPPLAGFLDIQNGSLTPIDERIGMVQPQTEIVWRDALTAVYVSTDEAGEPLLVSLDRTSGALTTSPLPLAGIPLSLAPNGSRLLAGLFAGEGMAVAWLDIASGEVTTLLNTTPDSLPSQIAWTPDGSKVALVRTVLPPDLAADREQVVALAMQESLGRLPPGENPWMQGNRVEVFDLVDDDHALSTLNAIDGDGYLFGQVSWSPDGRTLLAKMVRPSRPDGREYPTVWVHDRSYLRFYDIDFNLTDTLDLPEIEALATTAYFVSLEELMIVAPRGATMRLYLYNQLSGQFHSVPMRAGSIAWAPYGYQVRATHGTKQLIFNHSSFRHPPEIYRMSWDGSGLHKLTDFNATAAVANRIRVDRVTIRLKQGTTRTGYLLQPAGAIFPPRDVPLVLYQQGGPGGAMTNRWGATAAEPFNLLPNFGIAVLFMPFSGRDGLGPAAFNALANERNFGQLDIDEAAQVVRTMKALDYTAHGRIGITGCSYGGYFTSQSITRHPYLYAAANAQCLLLDLHQWLEAPGGTPNLGAFYAEGRLVAEEPEEYHRDSPIYQASNVRTPLLLFHGVLDDYPLDTAIQFHEQVEAEGTPVTLLAFEGEGHDLAMPSSRFLAAQWQIWWFQTYLAAPPKP